MINRRTVAVVAAIVCVALAGVVAAPPAVPAAAEATAPIVGSRVVEVTPPPEGTVDVGGVAPDEPVPLRIALEPRDPAALEAFAVAVSTPGSDVYRQYLSTADFAARFGAADRTIAHVRHALTSVGLRPGALAANHLSLEVAATAEAAQRGLDTHFVRSRLDDGRTIRRRDRRARLPAGAVAVIGLDEYPRRHRAASADPIPAPACSGSASTSGWTPAELAQAYDAGPLSDHTLGGVGQTIALYELSTYKAADVTVAQQCYGSRGNVTRVPIDGGAASSSGALEVALDADVVVGQAPYADVLVYEAPNTDAGAYDAFAAIVNDNRAQIVSVSWGLCEPLLTKPVAQAEGLLFAQAAAQGQTIFAASGDNGSADCGASAGSSALTVDDPASQPFVTGVGGTTLSTTSPRTERVWNSSAGATGGGISQFWSAPSYQAAATTPFSSGTPCGAPSGNCRQVPDVAASADPTFGYPTYCTLRGCGSGWSTVGGTSGAAPLWAGFIALVNEHCGPANRVGFMNPALYAATDGLNDVLLGDNDDLGTNGGKYPAGPGYDLATGLGSPSASTLATRLCGPFATAAAVRAAPGTVEFGTTTVGTAVARPVHLRSIGGGVAHVGSAAIQGPDASAFVIASDGCSAATLAPTEGCDIVVSFSAAAVGSAAATLVVPTDAAGGSVSVALHGTAETPRTTFAIAPSPIAFAGVPAGSTSAKAVTVSNTGAWPLHVGTLQLSGSASFSVAADGCSGVVVAAGATCTASIAFRPAAAGAQSGSLVVPDAEHPGLTQSAAITGTGTSVATTTTSTTFAPTTTAPPATTPPPTTAPTTPITPPSPPRRHGYWMVGRTGDVYGFGDARWFGNTSTSAAVVDLESTPSAGGYWTVDALGRVFAFGDAQYFGGNPALAAGESVTSISSSRSGGGYWLFTTAGRVTAYGDAPFLGDMAGVRLNGPVLDSIPTGSGAGYFMVASDGGIFTFGDARFAGSMGGTRLNAPVQSLVPDPDGSGYWLVASDGGIFAFDAPFHGSMGDVRLNRPITGMVASGAAGYLMVGEDGGIFTFGDARFDGSLGDSPPTQPITAVASLP